LSNLKWYECIKLSSIILPWRSKAIELCSRILNFKHLPCQIEHYFHISYFFFFLNFEWFSWQWMCPVKMHNISFNFKSNWTMFKKFKLFKSFSVQTFPSLHSTNLQFWLFHELKEREIFMKKSAHKPMTSLLIFSLFSKMAVIYQQWFSYLVLGYNTRKHLGFSVLDKVWFTQGLNDEQCNSKLKIKADYLTLFRAMLNQNPY